MAHSFTTVLTQTLRSYWGQGQSRGVCEPRLGLLMEPALFRGGSIHRTIYNIFCEKWVFSLKMYKFVREIWVAADSQRRINNLDTAFVVGTFLIGMF